MKKILNLTPILYRIVDKKKLDKLYKRTLIQLKPLLDRWQKFTPREKQLVAGLGGVVIIFVLLSIISSGIDIVTKLNRKYTTLQVYKVDIQSLQHEFKDLSKITANEFSSVNLSRLQGDVTQALGVKVPDVGLQDNVLTIKADNVAFDSTILLLEQLRKSYGIFPRKLKITQARLGYVNFSVTFSVSQ